MSTQTFRALAWTILLVTAACGGKSSGSDCAERVECTGELICTKHFEHDRRNCGGCGIACSDEQICAESVCQCPYGACGGVCIDLQNDSGNCGNCGVQCGDSCDRGTCVGEAIVQTFRPPQRLVVVDGQLYWRHKSDHQLSTGSIATAPASGGTPTTLLDHLPSPRDIAVWDTYLYVSDNGWISGYGAAPGLIARIDLTNGATTVVALGQLRPLSLDTDETSVVWINRDYSGFAGDGKVFSMRHDTGDIVTIADDLLGPMRARLGATRIYWLGHRDSRFQLMSARKDGTDVQTHDGVRGEDFLMDHTALYLWNSKGVTRWDKESGAQTTVMAEPIEPVALSKGELMWIEAARLNDYDPELTCLHLMPADGETSRIVTCNDVQHSSPVTADDDFVYWGGTHAIYRTPR